MYHIEDWDNKKKVIKRLSKYEKRAIWNLGDCDFDIKQIQAVIGIPHRSSMSRLITTLERKGLILSRPRETGGIYKKRISLTPVGKQVAIKINEETPLEELIP